MNLAETRTPMNLAVALQDALCIQGLEARVSLLECLGASDTNCIIERGLRRLAKAPKWWRRDLAHRILDSSADPDPVLGEIRAYGTLIGAGFLVEPVQTRRSEATPDFRIVARDKTTIIIDVATKDWDTQERTAFREFQSAPATPSEGRAIMLCVHESAPFGSPSIDPATGQTKSGDSVTTNVVQRLCGIKSRETQFQVDQTNILYLDLARGDPFPMISMDSTAPLRSSNESLTSGELFAAFYGRRGMPIYENRPLTYGARGMIRMAHDGRFALGSKLSAVIVSCRDGLALLENPGCTSPLSKEARRQIIECFGASLEHFWACFVSRKDLEVRIAQGIALLDHFTDIDDEMESS